MLGWRVPKRGGAGAIAVICGFVALGACGGSNGPSAAETKERKAYIDAAAAVPLSKDDRELGATKADQRCMGAAMVDTFGVAELKAAGVSPGAIWDTKWKKFPLPPTAAQTNTLGKAVQECNISRLLMADIATEEGARVDAQAKQCFQKGFNGADARTMAASLVLAGDGEHPSLFDARRLTDILLYCVDLTDAWVSDLDFKINAEERACLAPKLRASAAFHAYIAASMAGKTPDKKSLGDELGPVLLECLSQEHVDQLRRG